ncbi:efflux RND transporter permease subunit [Candidatus Peregrinibacteria bacterium]|nr:MAG: efflux RND transporter permease subunit [Candidatus Peregrinibacteria bacterium]
MDFNTRLNSYFLKNNRLTALCLLLLLMVGFGTTALLKTTGFPSPDMKLVFVQTLYLGASAETVAQEVTAPIELALRDVEGVSSFSSTSSGSFSMISVSLEEKADTDATVSRMDSAFKSVALPEGVEEPKVSVPSIVGPDFVFSLIAPEKSELHERYVALEKDIRALPETVDVAPLTALQHRILVTLDEKKMAEFGVQSTQVSFALSTLGESLPVISDVTMDEESVSFQTTLQGDTLGALKALSFSGHALTEFATVKEDFSFEGESQKVGLNIEGDGFVFEPLVFTVKALADADKGAYDEALREIFTRHEEVEFVDGSVFENGFGKTLLIEHYSVNKENERQVEEVVTGLVGGEWPFNAPFNHLGYALGGIQLVFLVMLAFVSWRAAFVSALALPLSLIFVNIYIYFIGESLNTLVLFSLVLAIGLVVDPALVLLESIQRKVDAGLNGKEAALAAVSDVGMGLFLACLTSVLVFVPFGVVSGLLGQIIVYIPMTIIPAVVGSYVVPLVFLTWIGGAFLKRGKRGDEEENLWSIAKLLIRFNRWILNGSRFLRFILIVLALVLPLAVAGHYFSSGQVKSVQFSSSENYDQLQLSYSHFPSTSPERREALYEQVLEIIVEHEAVESVFPLGQGMVFIQLKPALERPDTLSVDIAEAINADLEREVGEAFFDVKTGVISNGPPTGAYQVVLAVQTEDLELMERAAQEVAATLLKVCEVDNVFTVQEDCANPLVVKVDDGFTGKESTVIEVLLDRDVLERNQLAVPNAPLTLLVNRALSNLFQVDGGEAVGTVRVDGENVDIVLDKKAADPDSLKEIENTIIYSLDGTVLRLKDVAVLRSVDSPSSILRQNGETLSLVKARLATGRDDQATAAQVQEAVLDYYSENEGAHTLKLGLEEDSIEVYSEGDSASFIRSFQELFVALVLAILLTYVVLVVFFESFSQPLVILFAVPLTFIGVFPALAHLGNGQFGFLEIIGLIILVGIVENVAIFLIDAAYQKIREGWDEVEAISYASGLRLRAVILTKMTTLVSLLPLAILSEQYRSLSLVIMFGLLTSGVTSLFTTPILFIFFRWLSRRFHALFLRG